MASSPTLRVLGIFAKAPVPGHVKTRLAADIGAEAAAQWYARSLRVIFHRSAVAWAHVERVLFYDPASTAGAFDALPDAPTRRVRQEGADLGARMAAALRYCLALGTAVRPVLVGSDAPSLPAAYVTEAWDALGSHDVVLGPATDGGYYLIGTRADYPALFADMTWSTDRVLSETVARAERRQLGVHLLPEWFDVDTVQDLAALDTGWDCVP